MKSKVLSVFACACALVACVMLGACQQEMPAEGVIDETAAFEGVDDQGVENQNASTESSEQDAVTQDAEEVGALEEDAAEDAEDEAESEDTEDTDATEGEDEKAETQASADVDAMRAALSITEDYRDSFIHGPKGAEYQRYIVLHDTEGTGDGLSVVSGWDGAGVGVAAHFIVNTDGSIVQCVDMDTITHHAGFGDAGHNDLYGVPEDGRDDRVGTQPIGDWAPDYGMNSYSIGIEMVHVGGSGYYPEEQLQAVDDLIAYIDAYYGFESTIIDHKAWRTGNSDTSPEFAEYLANYQDHRTHN